MVGPDPGGKGCDASGRSCPPSSTLEPGLRDGWTSWSTGPCFAGVSPLAATLSCPVRRRNFNWSRKYATAPAPNTAAPSTTNLIGGLLYLIDSVTPSAERVANSVRPKQPSELQIRSISPPSQGCFNPGLVRFSP